ncbi:MAG: hypothetical protein WA840_14605 [Caulobacteraceae bacterium]
MGEALAAALAADMASRAAMAGIEGSQWTLPKLSGLRVRRAGLPDSWTANGNLLLASPDAERITPTPWFEGLSTSNSVIVLGTLARLRHATLTGDGALIVLGDDTNLHDGVLNAIDCSTILIGEKTSATSKAHLDARNGGVLLVGADAMWADSVRIMTDDMHAIRDLQTGERLNRFGGRIVIEPHVWLGEHVQVLGGSHIGADSVVGIGSLVKGTLPGNCICVGRPARPVRRGVTWSREDVA